MVAGGQLLVQVQHAFHADVGLFALGAGVDLPVAGETVHEVADLTTGVRRCGELGAVLFRAQMGLLRFEQRRRLSGIVPNMVVPVTNNLPEV